MRFTKLTAALALPLAAALLLSACQGETNSTKSTAPGNDKTAETVTLLVHDSFVDSKKFAAAASAATGYQVKVVVSGAGSELTNKLVLTKGAPLADAFYGVSNSFAARLIDNEVVAPAGLHSAPPRALSLGAEYLANPAPAAADLRLVPIDIGATCVNIDTGWFADKHLTPPETFADLREEKYRDLTVLIDPASSTTGASFMLATIAKYGADGFVQYWQDLLANGAVVAQGWSEAYNNQFSAVSDSGTRPIVVSYSTSPAFTVTDDGSATATSALLDTCSNQVEYAGVLAGAANPEGASAVIAYLLSPEFQSIIADEMYMYPVDESIELPANWAKFAPLPSPAQTQQLPADEIADNLAKWLRELGDAIEL